MVSRRTSDGGMSISDIHNEILKLFFESHLILLPLGYHLLISYFAEMSNLGL